MFYRFQPTSFTNFHQQSQTPNVDTSPIHHFLQKTCGLSPTEAVSASKHLEHLKTTEKPEQVVHLFREHGFSDTHIKALVLRKPVLLNSSIPNTLLPKLKLFEGMGIVDAQLADLISKVPVLLFTNIERTLLPGITFLQEQVKSNENIITVLRRASRMLLHVETVKENMLFLQNIGIGKRALLTLLIRKPRIFTFSEAKMKGLLDTAEKLGVPRSSTIFPIALFVVSCMAKDTLHHKINYLMSLGLSREEVLLIFKKLPATLAMSKDNVNQHMDFLVNTLNLEPLVIVTYPNFLNYSIEKRILPRYKVFQLLQSKAKLKIEVKFMTMLMWSEKEFLNKIIYKHSDCARLYEIYKGVDAAGFSVNYCKQKEAEQQ